MQDIQNISGQNFSIQSILVAKPGTLNLQTRNLGQRFRQKLQQAFAVRLLYLLLPMQTPDMACGRAMTRAAARRLSAALSCLDEKPAQARQNAGASISRALHSVASRIGNESPALTQALEQSGKSKVKRSLTHQWKSSGESRAVTKALQRALSSGSAAAAENSETLLSTQEGSVRMTTQALDHSDNRGASFAAGKCGTDGSHRSTRNVDLQIQLSLDVPFRGASGAVMGAKKLRAPL